MVFMRSLLLGYLWDCCCYGIYEIVLAMVFMRLLLLWYLWDSRCYGIYEIVVAMVFMRLLLLWYLWDCCCYGIYEIVVSMVIMRSLLLRLLTCVSLTISVIAGECALGEDQNSAKWTISLTIDFLSKVLIIKFWRCIHIIHHINVVKYALTLKADRETYTHRQTLYLVPVALWPLVPGLSARFGLLSVERV